MLFVRPGNWTKSAYYKGPFSLILTSPPVMPKRRDSIEIPSLAAIEWVKGLVGRQLAQALRDAISNGELKPGERLPSTRALADSLGLARATITGAFDQLRAEGYIEAQVGAGSRVTTALTGLPGPDLTPPAHASGGARVPPRARELAKVAALLAAQPSMPFSIAVPVDAAAPDDQWRRTGNRVRASKAGAPAGYTDPRGVQELRSAITEYLRKARAVRCTPEQVVITSGTQQGLYLAARVLLSPDDVAWIENPAYPGLTAVMRDLRVRTHRVAVDSQGLNVEAAMKAAPDAQAAFVTPSHQYPIGMPLSMPRRRRLLEWARQRKSWIVEDDYDSELRYAGHPFPSLQGLDPTQVVYLGTLSKIMFPSLRLGYVVAPANLVDAFAGARAIIDRGSPTADQHVLAAFMREGLFEAHIRRIRGVYAERREVLIEAVTRELSSWIELQPSDQGMHLVVWLKRDLDDVAVAQAALQAGISVRPISPMYERSGRSGLMLGFGGFPPDELNRAVQSMKAVFSRLSATSR